MALNVFGCGHEGFGVVVELPEAEVAGVAQQAAHLAGGVIVVDRPRSAASPRLVGPADGAAMPLRFQHGVVFGLSDAEEFESSQPRDARLFLGASARLDPTVIDPLATAFALVGAGAVLAVGAWVLAPLDLSIAELFIRLVRVAAGAVVHAATVANQSDMLINVGAVAWL